MPKCKSCKKFLLQENSSFCNERCKNNYVLRETWDGKCPICKVVVPYKRKYCSIKCRDIGRKRDTHITKECKSCKKKFDSYKKANKSFCSWECQQNGMSDVEFKKKHAKATSIALQRFHSDPNNTEQQVKKTKETKLRRYGRANYVNAKQAKQTKIKRYGDPAYNNQEKMKSTMMDKYGVDNYSKTDRFKNIHRDRVINRIESHINGFTFVDDPREYNGVGQKYIFSCNRCDTEFEYSINNGRFPKCPNCDTSTLGISQLEIDIQQFIESIHPGDIEFNSKNLISPLELDIYIPDKKIAIEVNGLYWHGETMGKDKLYHLNKTLECAKVGIHLIHIFEDEWVFKQDIVKNKLLHILGESNTKRIYARKCEIREISTQDKSRFLTQYHIQGNDKSSIKLGAFYNNELIACMTFAKPRIALGSVDKNDGTFELSRFATKYHVVGGASKLLSHFRKKYSPKRIITYADNRWSGDNTLYEQIGFTKIGNGVPGYWYIENGQRLHRYGFRKSVLPDRLKSFDPELTEWENMQINGYDRIWDCGHSKFEMIC